MSYIGENPKFDSVVFEQQYADLTAAQADTARFRLNRVVNIGGKLYQDDGAGTFEPLGGLDTLAKGSILSSNGTDNTELTAGANNSVLVYDSTQTLGFTTKVIGAADGIAPLDSNGLVPAANLPSYVDDVVEYANLASFPASGETGKIYVAQDTNYIYRWTGSAYVQVNQATSSVQEYANLAAFPATGSSDVIYLDAATQLIYFWDGSAYEEIREHVPEVETYANLAGFPATGTTAVLYIAEDTDLLYRWDGSAYQEVSAGSENVEEYANLAAFPASGATGVIYIDAQLNVIYYWDGTQYVILTGAGGLPTMSKGSILTSNGSTNGEFSAGADGEVLVYDSAEASGLKTEALRVVNASAPTVNDDTYAVGTVWVDSTNVVAYICLSNATGAANWLELSSGGGGMTYQSSVNTTINNNTTYTIPANQVFHGHVIGPGAGQTYLINKSVGPNWLIEATNHSATGSSHRNIQNLTLGGGAYIRGYANSISVVGYLLG